jgi:hypothetical protein
MGKIRIRINIQDPQHCGLLAITDSILYFFLCFRKVVFHLVLDGEVFISELESLEKSVCSFLHICFVTNIKYPVGSGICVCADGFKDLKKTFH